MVQVHVGESLWGFDSPLSHQPFLWSHMKYSLFSIMLLTLCLSVLGGCRSEAESTSFNAFDAAFERQTEALEILRSNLADPDKAKSLLEKLRSVHGDAVIELRKNKEQWMSQLSEKDRLYFEEVRDQLHEDLNEVLSSYPASRIKELRYLLMTL